VRQAQITFGHLERFVPEDALESDEVSAVHQVLHGKGVPK